MKLNRRHFLQTATLGLGALTLPSPLARGAGRASLLLRAPTMHLGLVTYNLAQDWDIPTLIKNCEAARFEGVELRTTHAHKVEVSLSKPARSEVRKRFEDSSVKLVSLGSIFDYHTPDQAKLRKDIDATKEYIVLAQDVGATGVKVRPNDLPREVPPEQTLAQIGRALRELGDFARDHGQVIRLEVHGTGTAFPPRIKTILDTANHPSVGACWNSNPSDLDGEG
jgi:sugar phosphate isomerase/epimerase